MWAFSIFCTGGLTHRKIGAGRNRDRQTETPFLFLKVFYKFETGSYYKKFDRYFPGKGINNSKTLFLVDDISYRIPRKRNSVFAFLIRIRT